MSFFSINFLLFFCILLFAFARIKSVKGQQLLLLLGSYVFYAFWDFRFLFLLLTVSAVVWYAAKYIRQSKFFFLVGVGVPIFSLGVCKYLNFFIESFCALSGIATTGTIQIILPLGISFYTFLAVSYVIDVYHGKIEAEDSFVVVALYIGFFLTIISGPITKARDILVQFKGRRIILWNNIQIGIQIFLLGCLKKFVLADRLSVFVNDIYRSPLSFDSATVWLAVLGYSLQLYFDFAGYSDMAIGCGRCLGIRLTENFNLPYLAKSISEFWKRWHISLSAWLQEYLYFSLGGSRCSIMKIYRNLMLTMLICGLWHGAAWNFVLWGGVHGLLLCLHRIYRINFGEKITLPVWLKVLFTYLSVSLCWVFFRGTDMQNVGEIFFRLFVWDTFGVHHMYVYAWLSIFVMLIVSVYAVYFNKWNGFYPNMNIAQPVGFFVFCMGIFLLFGLMYTGDNPFVYAAF